MPGELGSLKTLAREPAEPLRFDASGTDSAQSDWLTKGKVRWGGLLCTHCRHLSIIVVL